MWLSVWRYAGALIRFCQLAHCQPPDDQTTSDLSSSSAVTLRDAYRMWSSFGTCYARGEASCDFSGSLTMFQCTTWIQPMSDRVSGGKHHAWLSVFLIWQLRLWEGFPRLIGLRNLLQIQLKWEVKRRGCILFPVGAYQSISLLRWKVCDQCYRLRAAAAWSHHA